MEAVGSENWRVLLSLFPEGWEEEAARSKAVERLRGFDSTEAVIRTLLLHVARGYSLRETAALAHAAGLASVSDVTLLNRLQKAEEWLRWLCLELLQENGVELTVPSQRPRVRLLDGSIVREPGRTGSQWRLLYCLRLPSLLCDYFDLTPTQGEGSGEWLGRLPVNAGDLVLADAGYCSVAGMAYTQERQADVIVRINPQNFPCCSQSGRRRSLLSLVEKLREPGQAGDWQVWLPGPKKLLRGRVCALRKSEEAARQAVRRLRRKASQRQTELKVETLAYAQYVMVFTTWATAASREVLEWYRVRWQIELAFKRLKSLAGLGHLPKSDPASARAWLYGKLFVALLAQKLNRVARELSPWGHQLLPPAPQ
jgi:hypothetical protein